jgi:hypothetical protein
MIRYIILSTDTRNFKVSRLSALPNLEVLCLHKNPLAEDENYRTNVFGVFAERVRAVELAGHLVSCSAPHHASAPLFSELTCPTLPPQPSLACARRARICSLPLHFFLLPFCAWARGGQGDRGGADELPSLDDLPATTAEAAAAVATRFVHAPQSSTTSLRRRHSALALHPRLPDPNASTASTAAALTSSRPSVTFGAAASSEAPFRPSLSSRPAEGPAAGSVDTAGDAILAAAEAAWLEAAAYSPAVPLAAAAAAAYAYSPTLPFPVPALPLPTFGVSLPFEASPVAGSGAPAAASTDPAAGALQRALRLAGLSSGPRSGSPAGQGRRRKRRLALIEDLTDETRAVAEAEMRNLETEEEALPAPMMSAPLHLRPLSPLLFSDGWLPGCLRA